MSDTEILHGEVMTPKEQIAELKQQMAEQKAELDELKAKVSPPEKKPFVPAPYQQYDPTAGMSMPRSALMEMVNHPCNQAMRGAIQDRHAPTSATGMIPSSQQRADVRETSSTPGYVDPRPLSPPPGIGWVDAQLIADEVRQRNELKWKLGGG